MSGCSCCSNRKLFRCFDRKPESLLKPLSLSLSLSLAVGGSRLLADLRPAARRMPLYEELRAASQGSVYAVCNQHLESQEKFICPFSIRFSQARIRPTFQDRPSSQVKGKLAASNGGAESLFQDGREVEASMEQISAPLASCEC